MVLVALALAVLDRGTSMGEVRALVPPDLRPPDMPFESQNGWTLAMHASGQASTPRISMKEFQAQVWEGIGKPRPTSRKPNVTDFLMKWPDAPDAEFLKEARAALVPYADRFRFLEAAVSRPVWAPPRTADSLRPRLDEVEVDFPIHAGLKEVAKALSLRARVNAAEGRADAAVADVALSRRMGNRLAGGYAPIVPHLVGIAIEAIADNTAIQLASQPNMRDEHLAQLQAIIADAPSPSPARLANTLRCEFDAYFVRLVAGLPTDTATLGKIQTVPPVIVRALKGLSVYDRRDTIEQAAILHRVALENGTRPWSNRIDVSDLAVAQMPKWPDIKEPKPGQQVSKSDAAKIAIWVRANPNVMGRQLATMLGSTPGAFEEAERRTEARRRLTMTAIAVRRAALKSGQAPASLQALVDGGFLISLPADPFDKGPLRYDPARKVVWSVGSDGKDDGGSNRPNSSKPDIVIAVP